MSRRVSAYTETGPASEKTKLFVYGTLKRGKGNHRLMERAQYLGNAYMTDVLLTDLGGIPAAVEFYGFKTFGEVYSITYGDLWTVDGLEGHPGWYRRHRRTVPLHGDVWIYLQTKEQLLDPARPRGIAGWYPDGVWDSKVVKDSEPWEGEGAARIRLQAIKFPGAQAFKAAEPEVKALPPPPTPEADIGLPGPGVESV